MEETQYDVTTREDTGWLFADADDPDDPDWQPLYYWDFGSWQFGKPTDAEDAAESAAGQVFGEWEHPDSMKLKIRSPAGDVTTWDIEIRQEPVFNAIEAKRHTTAR